MSIREITMYQIVCNASDCEYSTKDLGSDYWAWSDSAGAEEEWNNSDGLTIDGASSREHYCHKHWAWCTECENEQIPSHPGAPEQCSTCATSEVA